jgi:Mn-dependent DtxR family transcriptional regulator
LARAEVALARAEGRLLEEGVYATRAALARAEGVSRAAVTQALRRLV